MPNRFHAALVTSLALLIVASQVLGATVLKGTLWGADSYAFFPPAVLAGATLALIACLGVIALRRRGSGGNATPSTGTGRRLLHALIYFLAGLSFALFWELRIRHSLFGDTESLSRSLSQGQSWHPRQPLSVLAHHLVYAITAGWFQNGARSATEVAFDTVALGSAVAGALMVPVAIGLGRELASSPGAPQADREAPPPAVPLLAAGVLLTQGYVELLFGYVENYTYFTLAMAVYVWAGLRFLRGRSPLLPAGLALVVAVGLNLSGLVLLPSFLAIAGLGLVRGSRRGAVVRDLAGTAAACAAVAWVIVSQGEAGQVALGLRQLWDLVVRGAGGGGAASLLSLEHLRDFLDLHLLIGPCGAFLAVPAALRRLTRGNRRDARLWFLLLCGAPPLAASWLFGDPLQGFPRDWDLFAPFGLLYAAAAVYCMLREPSASLRAPLLAEIVALSLFHTAPWVMLNTSAEKSLERYKTLPISRGRGEFTIGCWYLNHGQEPRARDWFWRSVEAYPGNNAAHYYLGLYAMDDGRFAEAARHFAVCVDVRPDKADYRLALADALLSLREPGAAAKQLALATQLEPSDGRLWACYGIALAGIGRNEEARQALDEALRSAPGDTLYARLRTRVGEPDAYARAVREDWPGLVAR